MSFYRAPSSSKLPSNPTPSPRNTMCPGPKKQSHHMKCPPQVCVRHHHVHRGGSEGPRPDPAAAPASSLPVPISKLPPEPKKATIRSSDWIPNNQFCPRRCDHCGYSFVPGNSSGGECHRSPRFCSGDCRASAQVLRHGTRQARPSGVKHT